MSPRRTTRELVRDFVLKELLRGEADADELDDSTPLFSTGILDSRSVLRLVTFLEDELEITVSPTEADPQNLNTISDIVDLVREKLGDS